MGCGFVVVQKRFGIELESHPHVTLKFEYIRSRYKLEASRCVKVVLAVWLGCCLRLTAHWCRHRYPRFTMLLQSLGAMMVAWECVRKYNPDIFFDTTGWAFSYFVAKGLARCKVVTYTHYPTITSVCTARGCWGCFHLQWPWMPLQDMLHRVHEQRPTYNNNADVSGSAVKTTIKVMSVALRVWLWLCEATHVVTMRVINLAQVLPDVRLRVWAHGSPRGYVHVQFQVDAGSSSAAVGPLL